MDECDFLVIQFAYIIKDVVKVFAIYVHVTLSNGCVVHDFIMETNTRWKIAMCDVRNCLVRSNIGRKRDNNTKSKIRKEVHHNINSNYIICIILLITVIFGVVNFNKFVCHSEEK